MRVNQVNQVNKRLSKVTKHTDSLGRGALIIIIIKMWDIPDM